MDDDDLRTERINKTRIGPLYVSTVILYSGFEERRVAETALRVDAGATLPGGLDPNGERDDPEEAEAMHAKWCRNVSAAIAAEESLP